MAELATSRETEAIKEIWRVAFGESKEFLNFIFNYFYLPENTAVCVRDGRPVSTAMFLPFELSDGRNALPASYVYGVATLPEYRRRGLMEEVLGLAHEMSAQRGKRVCYLIPQEPYLFDVYKKFGYAPAFEIYRGELSADLKTGLRAVRCTDAEKLKYMYEKALEGRPRALRGKKYLDLVLSEIENSGGIALSVSDLGYCIFSKSGDAYACTEVMADRENILYVFSACASVLGIQSCACVSPYEVPGLAPFYKGMIRDINLDKDISLFENAYLNVMLD